MNLAIVVTRFVGAWLLVIGPLNQATLELAREQVDRQALLTAKGSTVRPSAVPGWKWLIPPLAVADHLARRRRYRQLVFAQLTPQEADAWRGYSGKATAWLTVACGAVLLATGETWELAEKLHLPGAGFWILLIVVLACVVVSTAARQRRRTRPAPNATADITAAATT